MRVGEVGKTGVGVEFDGPFRLPFGAVPVPVVPKVHERQRGMRLGERVVEFQRPDGGRFGLRQEVSGTLVACDRHRAVRFGQALVGQGIVLIERHRLSEQVDARLDFRRGQLVEVITSEQVKLVGLDVVGLAPVQTLLRRAVEPQRQGVGHFLRDGVLQGKHVGETLVERAVPPGGAIRHVDQAGVHADAVSGSLHVALQHGVDAQFAPGGPCVQRNAGILAHRVEGRDHHLAAAEFADQRIGHAEFQRRVTLRWHQRLERKDRHRFGHAGL